MELDVKAGRVMQLHCHPGLDGWASPCCDDSMDCTQGCAGPNTEELPWACSGIGAPRGEAWPCVCWAVFSLLWRCLVCVGQNVANGSVITQTLQTVGRVQEDLWVPVMLMKFWRHDEALLLGWSGNLPIGMLLWGQDKHLVWTCSTSFNVVKMWEFSASLQECAYKQGIGRSRL